MVAERKHVNVPGSTSKAELDAQLQRLRAAAPEWVKSSIDDRLALLRQFMNGYLEVAEDLVMAGLEVKGIDPSTPLAAEEWLAGAMPVIRNLRLLIETLEKIKSGKP